MLVNVDAAPSDAVMERLRSLPHVISRSSWTSARERRRARARRRRRPVGRRGQGQDRRLARARAPTWWCASRAATTPATRWSSTARRRCSTWCPRACSSPGTREPDRPRRGRRPARAARASSTSWRAKGVLQDPARVRVSGRAHVILDWHIALDKARDEARARGRDRHHRPRHRPGLRGQGRAARHPRRRPARPRGAARARSTASRAEKNFELTQLHHWPPIDADAVFDEYARARPAARALRRPHRPAPRPGAARRARTCCSRARRARSSTSTTAPTRT